MPFTTTNVVYYGPGGNCLVDINGLTNPSELIGTTEQPTIHQVSSVDYFSGQDVRVALLRDPGSSELVSGGSVTHKPGDDDWPDARRIKP
jgi:hypothetical protein